MQGKNIRPVFFDVPLRHKIAAAGLVVAIANGFFWWSRHEAKRPAMPAVLSFDGSAAQQANPGIMSANEPAVTLAQSILSDEAVDELAKQAGVSSSKEKSAAAEFRSRLAMAQPSVASLQVNYRDADKNLSVKAANAAAHLLVAWKPPVVVPVSAAPPQAAIAPAEAHPLRHSQTAPQESDSLRALEAQLSGIDREIAAQEAEPGQTITPGTVSEAVGAQAANSEEVQRHLLETQLIAAQKKLDDLRVRYTDEYPDVETAKENIAEIQKELAALKRPASPQTVDAGKNDHELDLLRAKRDDLKSAIAAEKLRAATQRKNAVPAAEGVPVAAQTATAPSQTLVLTAAEALKNPFTLVRPAEDPTTRFPEGNLLLIGALTGMLCGLLYLGGSMWQYQPEGSPVSDVEEMAGYGPATKDEFSPIAHENFRGKQAMEARDERPVAENGHQVTPYASSTIASEESWEKEIKKAMSQTEVGREDEVLAIRDEVLAVREEALVSHGAWLQEQAQYDEVLQAVRDNVKRNPNSWMAHTEAARLALAKSDFNAALKEIKNAIALAPEKARPGLNQIVLQLSRSAQPDM